MNPCDFYYLDDFPEFSPYSPNHQILTWYHRLGFDHREHVPLPPFVPIPENSFVAYHKEIYTVLFDPPSFLMVHSIVCHLLKKSKMEKKFLPLPPIPIRKSPHESLIGIQEPLSDSISEAEEAISVASTSVLESISANNHSFGTFHYVVVPIKLINAVQPHIEGCAIKIGEITCSLVSFRSANSQSMNSIVKVETYDRFLLQIGSETSDFIIVPNSNNRFRH
ncbi:hypothetical protein QL285_035180 [Trifolium repens]|nr:hypothetical protein QL285_035180 [Trifolium repens]